MKPLILPEDFFSCIENNKILIKEQNVKNNNLILKDQSNSLEREKTKNLSSNAQYDFSKLKA
jgi:hypothetical protein